MLTCLAATDIARCPRGIVHNIDDNIGAKQTIFASGLLQALRAAPKRQTAMWRITKCNIH